MSGASGGMGAPNAPKAASSHQLSSSSNKSSSATTLTTTTTTTSTTSTSTSSTPSSHHHHHTHHQHHSTNPMFDSNVLSERVKNLATQIYPELNSIRSHFNNDGSILSGLTQLIVRVLESLDLALIENQQLQVELELCKDDNEQLVVMFEKEKAAKRAIDKKLIESEYAYEEERQQYQQKIESIENAVKMYELKAKNASDQAARFEEKEAERKKEYNKLHDRYTELLKSHCDVVERVRHLSGNEGANFASINVVPPHHQSQQMVLTSSSDLLAASDSAHPSIHNINDSRAKSDVDANEFDNSSTMRARESTLKSWSAETELTLEDASLVVIEDITQQNRSGDKSSQNESDKTHSEPEGEHENDSIAYTSMEKEFRKLIQDNKDLLNTKNALNVVKDDLISEVDRLTNEVSMYEQAMNQLNATKDKLKLKIFNLDTELRKTKDELEKAKQKIRESNEEGVPYNQRKRFGRAEMAKVLMERNEYKIKYMELQEAVKYTELVRANKAETEKPKTSLWKFFSNLIGGTMPRDQLAITAGGNGTYSRSMMSPSDSLNISGSTLAGLNSADGASIGGGSLVRSTNQRLTTNSDLIVLMDSDLNIDRSKTMRDSRTEHSGYINAYGWSLPVSSIKNPVSSSQQASVSSTGTGFANQRAGVNESNLDLSSQQGPGQGAIAPANTPVSAVMASITGGLKVPIPQYCRPLTGDSIGMKIWCATAIDLSGGDSDASDNDTSGSLVNITSTPIKSPQTQGTNAQLRRLERQVDQALQEPSSSEVQQAMEVTSESLRGVRESLPRPILRATTESVKQKAKIAPYNDSFQEDLSSCVWICSTQHSRSKITIIDIQNKPNELLDSFYVPTFLYCIKSVPGCKQSDLPGLKPGVEQGASEQAAVVSTLKMLQNLVSNQKRPYYKLVELDYELEFKICRQRLEAKRKSLANIEQHEQEQQQQATSFDAPVTSANEDDQSTSSASHQRNDTSKASSGQVDDAEISRVLDNNASVGVATLQKLNDFVAHTQPATSVTGHNIPEPITTDEANKTSAPNNSQSHDAGQDHDNQTAYHQSISTHLSTVWMGGRDCMLYVHSAIGQWNDCVACVKLPDAILQIYHFRGRIFVALADGSLCVFFRNFDTKQWDFSHYLIIDVNLMCDSINDLSMSSSKATSGDSKRSSAKQSEQTAKHQHQDSPQEQEEQHQSLSEQLREATGGEFGQEDDEDDGVSIAKQLAEATLNDSPRPKSKVAGIRCIELANNNLWIGYRNRVLILEPISMTLRHSFGVVPQMDNQIRQLTSFCDGVFCCLRSDLILRLYSSLRPYQHIQNIDTEPIVTRFISPRTFVISHITSMKVANNTLWIGNAHGIVMTIPCKLVTQVAETPVKQLTGDQHTKDSDKPRVADTQIGLNDNADVELSNSLTIAKFVPECDISNAQISFHGHRDAVKFFINAHNLMLSGGQGYLDFRMDMDDQCKSINDRSHLILWQLPKEHQMATNDA